MLVAVTLPETVLCSIVVGMNSFLIAFLGGGLGMLGYGSADFLAKKVIDTFGVPRTIFFTQLITSLLLCLFLLRDASLPTFSTANLLWLAGFALFDAAGYLCLYRAFQVGKVSIVSPVASSFTILTALVSHFGFAEPFSGWKIACLALVIGGIMLIAVDPAELKRRKNNEKLSRGVGMALCVTLIFGIFYPFWDRFLSVPGYIVWVILERVLVVLLLGGYLILAAGRRPAAVGPAFFLIVPLIAAGETLARFGNSWALHATTGRTSLITALTALFPLVTLLLAHLFLKERLQRLQYAGILLVMAGLALAPLS
jgi:drug/metabolite transporter (DMT)-like permease